MNPSGGTFSPLHVSLTMRGDTMTTYLSSSLSHLTRLSSTPVPLFRVTVKKVPGEDEWVCRLSENGRHCPDADYFTDDREDAHSTAKEMLHHAEIGFPGIGR
jgi:hypothetical protein